MKFLQLAVAGGLALGLAACGDDDDAAPISTAAAATTSTAVVVSTPAPSAETAASADDAQFNDADVEFARGMIPHHEQAIEMADIALDPTVGASESVRDLAKRIRDAQDPEIELMTGWLTAWDQPVTMDTSGGEDMSDMQGMMTAEEMESLAALNGADFDTMWREMMIRHHEGAIAMAAAEQEGGANPEAIDLAATIIEAQQAEIDEMRAALGSG